jgi:TatD DNase family protein
MWIDTHAHLFDLTSEQLHNTINEAVQSSVSLIISTAINIETGKKVLEHCEQFSVLSGAIGISPFDIENLDNDWDSKLRSLLKKPKIIAVGEIGLDSSDPKYPPFEKQLPFFVKQLT